MDGLRQYVISVTSAALICSILLGLMQKGPAKELIKLLCGLFPAFTVIRPLSQLDIDALIDFSWPYTQEAEEAAAVGEDLARKTMAGIIKAESEAYILDKAAGLNAELAIDITISDAQVPVSAEICGEVSPYARQKLETILETDLGITKENQIWTG